MKKITLIILALSITLFAESSRVGQCIEQATVGAMFSTVCGFVAGEAAWVASPKFSNEADKYRISRPAAITAAYTLGVPFGAALGAHLDKLALGQETSLWWKWMGAELGALAGGAVAYLIYNNAEDKENKVIKVVSFGLPIITSVGGTFLGDFAADRLGLSISSSANMPEINLGFIPVDGDVGVSCKISLHF